MTSVRRLEHVELFVSDLPTAVAFYTDVFGLVELDRVGETVYLGCGLDGNFDVALTGGETGIEHLAIRTGDRSLADYEASLDDHDVAYEGLVTPEPGIEAGVRFGLPSGQVEMEVVDVEDPRYHNPANVEPLPTVAPVHPDRSPIAPRDLDHVGLYSSDLEADVEFLQDVLDFRLSDVGVDETGDRHMVFTRAGQHHHEVVVFDEPGPETLGHLAWDMTDIAHLQQFADHLVGRGYELETPMVRHGPGSNVATYFVAPGGNRMEVTTGVETMDPSVEMREHRLSDMPFCAWSDVGPPESFLEGS